MKWLIGLYRRLFRRRQLGRLEYVGTWQQQDDGSWKRVSPSDLM